MPDSQRRKILKFIQREEESGRVPTPPELDEIITYLLDDSGSKKEFPKQKFFREIEEAEASRLIKFIKESNCLICNHLLENSCGNSKSSLFGRKIDSTIVCNKFERD